MAAVADRDAEREIDLGALGRSLVALWWVVAAGFVGGFVLGALYSLGGGSVYIATARIAPGQAFNPNGSAGGLTAVTTADGRFTAVMPHPERVFRNVQMSWTDGDRAAHSPWMGIWRNARRWVG